MRRARIEDKDVREIIKKDEMQLLESASVFSIRINQHPGYFEEHKMGDAVKISEASTETYARSASLLHRNTEVDFNETAETDTALRKPFKEITSRDSVESDMPGVTEKRDVALQNYMDAVMSSLDSSFLENLMSVKLQQIKEIHDEMVELINDQANIEGNIELWEWELDRQYGMKEGSRS